MIAQFTIAQFTTNPSLKLQYRLSACQDRFLLSLLNSAKMNCINQKRVKLHDS
jgi:hypothetical protein